MRLFVHELIAETDLAMMQTVKVQQRGLRSNDHMHFLADLNTTRRRAAHDESPLVTAAVKLK